MDIDRLKEFRTIVERGSFKDAAAEIGVAPNVLSTRFRSFERSLNTTLIHRNAHSFELTSSGRILYDRSEELLRDYADIIGGIRGIGEQQYRSLKIQICAQSMPVELGPYLDTYCRMYPQLYLGIYDENTCRIREGLMSGQTDISFAIGREGDFADIPGRIVIAKYPRLKVHVASDHRLANEKTIDFSDLSGETFILYPRMHENHTRDLHKSLLDQSGIEYTIYDESHSPFFYDLLVPVGKGVSLWSWNFRRAPNTVLLTIRDPGYDVYTYLLYDPASSNPATEDFIKGFFEFKGERR